MRRPSGFRQGHQQGEHPNGARPVPYPGLSDGRPAGEVGLRPVIGRAFGGHARRPQTALRAVRYFPYCEKMFFQAFFWLLKYSFSFLKEFATGSV